MTQRHIGSILLILVASAACQFHARSPEDYRKVTRELVETRSAKIKQCYDGVLKGDANASGTVAIRFTVMEDSGDVTGAEVLPESTAPATVGQCIVDALQALTLTPPDARKGQATFVWEFKKAG